MFIKKFKPKYIANILFLTISCLLVSNLLIQLSDNPIYQVIYVVVAVALDIYRQFIIATARALWRLNRVRSIAWWCVYGVNLSVVLIAGIGFSLSAIDAKSKTADVYNLQRQSIINNINANEQEIKTLQITRDGLKSFDWKFKDVSGRIDSLQRTNRELFVNLGNFKEIKINIQKNIFDNLGKPLHIDGGLVEYYTLLVISLLIELALLTTSWDIEIKSQIETSITPIKPEAREFETPTNPETATNETLVTPCKPEIPKDVTPDVTLVTDNVTDIKSHVTTKKPCPVCGKPVRVKATYCGARCRQVAHRQKGGVTN